jgi:hypothetical protein
MAKYLMRPSLLLGGNSYNCLLEVDDAWLILGMNVVEM